MTYSKADYARIEVQFKGQPWKKYAKCTYCGARPGAHREAMKRLNAYGECVRLLYWARWIVERAAADKDERTLLHHIKKVLREVDQFGSKELDKKSPAPRRRSGRQKGEWVDG